MSTKYSADDMPSIAQRLKEIEAEKMAAIMGKPLEDPKPVEAPADIDWTGAYGMYTPCGYMRNMDGSFVKISDVDAAFNYTPNSLAHPEWPYTGTPHAWRVRFK